MSRKLQKGKKMIQHVENRQHEKECQHIFYIFPTDQKCKVKHDLAKNNVNKMCMVQKIKSLARRQNGSIYILKTVAS